MKIDIGTKFGIALGMGVFLLTTGCSLSKKHAQSGDDPMLQMAEVAPTDPVPANNAELLDPNLDAEGSGVHSDKSHHDTTVPNFDSPGTSHDELMTSSHSFNGSDYKVKSGDTLMKIAFDVYGDLMKWRAIYDLNKSLIPDPSQVQEGISLKMPGLEQVSVSPGEGEKYRIKKGDTLGSISREVYGTQKKWKKILENNRQLIKDPNKIFAGFDLFYVMSSEDLTQKEHFQSQMGSVAAVPAPPVEALSSVSTPSMESQAAPTPQVHSPKQDKISLPAATSKKHPSDGSAASAIPDLAVPPSWNKPASR